MVSARPGAMWSKKSVGAVILHRRKVEKSILLNQVWARVAQRLDWARRSLETANGFVQTSEKRLSVDDSSIVTIRPWAHGRKATTLRRSRISQKLISYTIRGYAFQILSVWGEASLVCFICISRGLHGLTSQDLYFIKEPPLIDRHDHRKNRAIKIGTTDTECFIVFLKI